MPIGYAWIVNDSSHTFAPAGDNPADIVLHFIAKITDAIEFPVGDAEFDAALDDCIAALAGSPSTAEDRAHAERALRGLLGQTDRLGLPVPKELRDESLCALAAGKPHAGSAC